MTTQENQNQETGKIDNIFLPAFLKKIEEEQRTGLLVLDSNIESKIYFNRGIPVYCDDTNSGTSFLNILLNAKKISSDQYNELQEQAEGNNENDKIIEILISKGYISPHEINEYLELQIKEKMIQSFLLTEGNFSFKYNEGIPENIYPSNFILNELIYEGIMRFVDVGQLQNGDLHLISPPDLFDKAKELNLGPKDLRIVQMITKKQPLGEIFENANIEKETILKLIYFLAFNELVKLEGVSIEDIGKASFQNLHPESEDAPRSFESDEEDVLILDEASIVNNDADVEPKSELQNETGYQSIETNESEISKEQSASVEDMQLDIDQSPSASSEEKDSDPREKLVNEINEFHEKLSEDYYQLLQVDENAQSTEIKNSYLKLVKKFHPDKILNYPEDVSNKAEEIFSKITVAYETLIDEGKRSDYDSRTELDELKGKASNIFEAEVRFNEGEVLLRHRNYREAENKFKEAIQLNPDEAAYIGAHGWAKFNSAEDKESASAEIIKLIENAISKDPKYAKNYFYLGSVYKIMNNLHKAEKNFEKAIEIDKTLIEAKRELRLIVNRRKERKDQKTGTFKEKGLEKRFWSGLFKK